MFIGFFDSGIGGLSVLYEALKVMPQHRYLYYADSLHAPYGTRSKESVKALVIQASDFLADKGLKALVIACNTATSAAIEDLRARYSFPVIGMEPAVKPALALAEGKRVMVFATELTLKLDKFIHLVARIDPDKRVDFLPLQELVMPAERFEFERDKILPYLLEKLSPVNWQLYGAVVLGCTHFPFYIPFFREILPAHIRIVDGNQGTVNHLQQKIGSMPDEPGHSVQYFLSGQPAPAADFERYFPLLRP